MRTLIFLAMIAVAAPAAAQHRKGPEQQAQGRGGQNMSHEERRKLREDVDSARGNYGRQEPRQQERMAPAEREKLRRDVQDANRDMRRR